MRYLPLAALLLSAPAAAQSIGAAAARSGAWDAAVSGAFAAAGADRVATLGSPSLTAMTTLGADGRFAYQSAPAAMKPLVSALQLEHAPEAFAALPAAEKLAALHRAATVAEAGAATVAAAALTAAAEPVRIKTYADVSRMVAAAEAVSFYLPQETAEKVAGARAALATYEARRKELIRAFLEDLPDRIAAGEFDATNMIRRDADGWYAADDAPEARYDDLGALYAARLQRVADRPAGPWNVEEYTLLRDTLDRPEVAAAVDAAALKGSIASALAESRDWPAAHPKVRSGLGRFAAGKPSGKDARALEAFYEQASDRFTMNYTDRARVEAWILKGDAVLPSWDKLQALKRALRARYNSQALVGMGLFFSGLLSAATIGASAWPAFAKLGAVAAMFVAMGWMFGNIWRRDALDSWGGSSLFELRRYARRNRGD